MAKISKIYPSFYNGISEQVDELILETQCTNMVNCVPSVVNGVTRRNGVEYINERSTTVDFASNKFHSYDRGEGVEQYVFARNDPSNSSSVVSPLIVSLKDGTWPSVNYPSGNAEAIDTYLGTVDNLKALTVQDRTFIVSIDKEVGQTTVPVVNDTYKKVAFYWLKRSSSDTNNEYNYAVYLNSVTYEFSSYSSSLAAVGIANLVNGSADFTATVIGSIIEIKRTDGADFDYSYWDSWGNQASFGFKGTAGKLTDLPKEMPFDDVYVNITGDDNNEFNDYYVKWTDDNWTEWKDPEDTRGTFTNMPIKVDREADGSFSVDFLEWEEPTVGNEDTNVNPSFVGGSIRDLFFYKNRLGFASGDNVILSELGGYYNFYIKTVLSVLETDPIDVAIASTQASKIYHIKPFQRGLYIFTADSQFELISQGALSPATVSIVAVSNYTMDVDVTPIVSGSSLYFISLTSDSKSQLREYVKDENSLVTKGVDVSLSVPSLLPKVDALYVNSTLGYVVCFSKQQPNTLYIFKTSTTGAERVQSAWIKWEVTFDIIDMYLFDTNLYFYKDGGTGVTIVLKLPILPVEGTKEDEVADGVVENFSSYFTLPKWMPKFGDIRNPIDNVQIKLMSVYGLGTYNVDIYRKGYDYTMSQTYVSGSLKNNNAVILGSSNDVVITVKSNDVDDFRVSSLTLEGFYSKSSKEVG